MRAPVVLLLTATLALSACQSRWNPANWWGKDRQSGVQVDENPLIPEKTDAGRSFFVSKKAAEYTGAPVSQVTNVEVHRVAEGVLVMAVGVSAVHGTSNTRLISQNGGAVEGGVLTLDLLGIPPEDPIIGGADQTREVTTAVVLTDQQMAGVRTIRVKAANNSMDRRAR